MPETRCSFFVGGRYVESGGELRMTDQAYVQMRAPDVIRWPYPVVMIHGGHQTAINFETTPDGRPGWADEFIDAGYVVYLMDQPGRGRSTFTSAYGPSGLPHSTARIEQRTTAAREYVLWPQASLHTQWPGTGHVGDPVFDQFYASQASCIADRDLRERLMRAAGAALLDRIGSAVLLTHSQSGHFGWHIADERPSLVRGIIAVEPGGPPFYEVETVGAPEYYRQGKRARPYGLTSTPLTYDPPVTDPGVDLRAELQAPAAVPNPVPCYLQSEPARGLVNLASVPVHVITGEASYHAGYDDYTVRFLRQAGVDATHIRLADEGIHGNGHMMMLEKNSAEIAALIMAVVQRLQ